MAAPVWKTYAVRPSGFGGIATFWSWVQPGSEDDADAVLEIRAKVGPAATTNPSDPTLPTVTLPLDPNGQVYAQGLLAGAATVSWFARTASGWSAGPVREVDLSPSWDSMFDYPKAWVVRLLQLLEGETAPLGAGRRLQIRTAYPRDAFPPPCISVNFEASPASSLMLGDVASKKGPQTVEERRAWTVTFGINLWCLEPEERDELAPWLLRAMQALVHLAPYNNLSEPTYSISESEDFSGSKLERALFVTSCQLSGTMWSSLTVPVHNPVGHFTL